MNPSEIWIAWNLLISFLKKFGTIIPHVRKVGPNTRDCWWDLRPGTHLIGGARDPRSGTLKVWPKTREPVSISKMGPRTQDPKSGTGDPRPLVYVRVETQDAGSRFSENFLSFLWSLAIMNELMCLMRVSFSSGKNTFNLLSSSWVTLSYLLQKRKFNFYHAAAMKSLNFRKTAETSDNS